MQLNTNTTQQLSQLKTPQTEKVDTFILSALLFLSREKLLMRDHGATMYP